MALPVAARHCSGDTSMIDLYAMGSPNVVKIYIALEEMGLPYTSSSSSTPTPRCR
jgi:hypothetical protein